MRGRLAKMLLAVAMVLGGATFANVTLMASPASACGNPSAVVNSGFFNLRPWYHGLTISGGTELCRPVAGSGATTGGNNIEMRIFIWRIVGNVADILLTLIGYAAVLFVLVGGFWVMFSSGDPAKMARGKTTIGNALIGVVIAVCASGAVRFINDALFVSGTEPTITADPGGVNISGAPTDTDAMWMSAVSNFLFMMGIAAVAMVVWGGVKLSASAGNPQAQAKAKNTVIFALAGMVVMVLAGALVRIVFNAANSGT
ncbi:pilin [Candidatus Saccharibacteria bacterium]|nr:pilin [Candidatus Saccharibacteria bacterium]